jgi:hypothetical protein
VEDALRALSPRLAATFAASSAERTVGLWDRTPDRDVATAVRAAMDSAWSALVAGEPPAATLLDMADRVFATLGEDADFGAHHSLLFDSVVAVGHAATAAAYAASDGDVVGEALLAAKSCVTLVKGAYQERHGTYEGAEWDESVGAERDRQRRDADELGTGEEAELIERLRRRARRESVLFVSGVFDGDWSVPVVDEDWPTLF